MEVCSVEATTSRGGQPPRRCRPPTACYAHLVVRTGRGFCFKEEGEPPAPAETPLEKLEELWSGLKSCYSNLTQTLRLTTTPGKS